MADRRAQNAEWLTKLLERDSMSERQMRIAAAAADISNAELEQAMADVGVEVHRPADVRWSAKDDDLVSLREVRMVLSSQRFYRRLDDVLRHGGIGTDICNAITDELDEAFPKETRQPRS